MFGLTRREQRWKAEQQIAEVLLPFAASVVKAQAAVEVARPQANSDELKALREEVSSLRSQLNLPGAPALPSI